MFSLMRCLQRPSLLVSALLSVSSLSVAQSDDSAAPELSIPLSIVAIASGPQTVIDLGVASAVDDVDGVITPEASFTGPFEVGHYEIEWSAIDDAGNASVEVQTVDVMSASALVELSLSTDGPIAIRITKDQLVTELIRDSYLILLHDSFDHPIQIELDSVQTISDEIGYVLSDNLIKIDGTNFSVVGATLVSGGGSISADPSGTSGEHGLVFNAVNLNAGSSVSNGSLTGDSVFVCCDSVTFSTLDVTDSLDGITEISAVTLVSSSEMVSITIDSETLLENNFMLLDGNEISVSFDSISEYMIHDISYVDANDNKIPDQYDKALEVFNLPSISDDSFLLQTSSNVRLSLGDFAASSKSTLETNVVRVGEGLKNYGADVALKDLEAHYGSIAETTNEMPFGIYDFEIHNVPEGESASIVLPLQIGLVEGAQYQKFTEMAGWTDFYENHKNLLATAQGALGVCPAPESTQYTEGLTPGHYCLRVTIEDGGPNDADGIANGVIVDPGGLAVASIPTPVVSVSVNVIDSGDYSANAGEQLVMSLTLVSDSADVALQSLSLEAAGSLDDVNLIGDVTVYVDANNNGQVESAELLGAASYSQDNGQVTIELLEAMHLKLGETQLLVTYQF